MKIAMSLLSGVGYGGVVYFNNLIPALAKADVVNEYHFFISKSHPFIEALRQDNFVFHECVKNNQSALKRFLWEQFILPRELKRLKIDIMFTAKNINIFLSPCKTIIAIRNMEPLRYGEYKNDWMLNLFSWIKFKLTKLSIKKADKVVAVSEAVRDYLEKLFPGIGKKIHVIYNGNPVNIEAVNFLPKIDESFLLTASKFVAYANQLNLIEGYAILSKKYKNSPPLWFAGGVHDKQYFKQVHNRVQELGLVEKIKFLGIVPHEKLLSLYKSAQGFLFPSTLEACPHTLIEAMACGVPIATSNVPPMSEICQDAALYFNPYDPKDIVKKIELILSNKLLQARLRSDGLERSVFFTWEKTAVSLLKIFKDIYSQKKL